jgi:PadR family transcriptional regulator AphA
MEYPSPRGFPAEYVVLGYLCDEPLHGYDLCRRIADGLGSVWRVATSQLYGVLHRLEERGWVTSTPITQEGRPERRVHTVTGEGRRAFVEWATSPVARFRDLRVVFLAKVYFLRRLDSAAVPRLLDGQLALLERTAARLRRRGAVPSDDPAFGAVVASFRRGQIEQTMAWLKESRELLERAKERG